MTGEVFSVFDLFWSFGEQVRRFTETLQEKLDDIRPFYERRTCKGQ